MPTRTDVTVVNQAYDTSGNGGRKLVRLSNGWLVAGVKRDTLTRIIFYVSKDNGASWEQLCTINPALVNFYDFAIVSKNTRLFIIYSATHGRVKGLSIEVTTQTNIDISPTEVDVETVTQDSIGNVSLAINEAGTELHAAWSSKNSTYPNSFNIRYAKGTINADGSVTWGAVEQVTSWNTSGIDTQNPSISLDKNGSPVILAQHKNATPSYWIVAFAKSFTTKTFTTGDATWGNKTVYAGGSYAQLSPCAIFVPSEINGLPNGLIGNAWHGTDSASGGVNYIRFSKSTDLGANWSPAQKLVPGTNPTLTANRNGKLFITYEDNGVTKRIESTDNGDTWSAPITVGNGTNPSSLFDLTLNMSEPLTIRKGTTSVLFSGAWVVTTISVTPGYIGQKTSADKSNILSYSITTDGEMSDIIEKINGVTIATRTNPTSGQQFTVSLSQEQWDAIKYGNGHTLTIEMGSDTWTYTFDKRLNANDDILSAVKGVQDLEAHLNAIKAQLAAAIRAKGGTVNDTDAWSTMINVLKSINVYKIAKGTFTTDGSGNFAVNNLAFRPIAVMAKRVGAVTYPSLFYADSSFIGDSMPMNGFVLNTANVQTISLTISDNGFSNNTGIFSGPYANSQFVFIAIGQGG